MPPEVELELEGGGVVPHSRRGGGATAAAKPVGAGTELAPGAEQPPGAADENHADCEASAIVRVCSAQERSAKEMRT